MRTIGKAEFMRRMAVGSKWTFAHSRFPERGAQPREVVRHEKGRVVFLGPAKPGDEPTVIDGPGKVQGEVFEADDDGTILVSIPGVTLTYKPAN